MLGPFLVRRQFVRRSPACSKWSLVPHSGKTPSLSPAKMSTLKSNFRSADINASHCRRLQLCCIMFLAIYIHWNETYIHCIQLTVNRLRGPTSFQTLNKANVSVPECSERSSSGYGGSANTKHIRVNAK